MKERMTIQKKYILEALMELNHPTALEIYEFIYKKYPNISKATIHRNLNSLKEEGTITMLADKGPAKRYDLKTENHYHFICKKCNEVYDLKLPYQKQLDNDESLKEFKVDSHTLSFTGLCPKCRPLK